jgi:hypothetical protein
VVVRRESVERNERDQSRCRGRPTAGSVSVSMGSSMPVRMATNLKWRPSGDG